MAKDYFEISKGINFDDLVYVTYGTLDPTTGSGVVAPLGSFYIKIDDATWYIKTSTGAKDWTLQLIGGAGSDTTAIHDDTASEISAITAKTEPVDADYLVIEDSADTNKKKSVTRGALFHNSIISYHDATISTISVGLGAGSIASNTAIGKDALKTNTTGAYNTAIGYSALEKNTTGKDNTALGLGSLYVNTFGNRNTGIGVESLGSNTTGNYNVALGYESLYSNTYGNDNTAIGHLALVNVISGINNTAIGSEALRSNVTGSGNIAVGYKAGYNYLGANKLFIDNQDRGSAALELTGALIVGAFDATPANQTLVLNAATTISNTTNAGSYPVVGALTIAGGLAVQNDIRTYKEATPTTWDHMLEKWARVVDDGAIAENFTTIMHYASIANGKSATGGITTFYIYSQRWGDDPVTDSGSLEYLNGIWLDYGHDSNGHSYTPVTTTIDGFVIQPRVKSGTVTELVDLRLKAIETGGTVTTHYAIKQEDTAALNNFQGASTFALDASIHGLTVGLGAGSIATNTALGYEALKANTTGSTSVALGYQALYAHTIGSQNVAVGYRSLYSITTGISNVAIGSQTLHDNIIGNYNVAIGNNTLHENLTNYNIGIGAEALLHTTTGANNTAIGHLSLASNITGSNNVAIGYYAGYYNISANKLFIDNQDRGSAALELTNALIVGTFDAVPANQTLVINGALSTPYQITSTLASGGVSPLVVASTTVVTNLNADLLDGNHAAAFAPSNYTGAGIDTTAIHDNVASEISAIAAKTEPIDADFLVIEDSADTNNKKSVTRGALFHNSIISYHDATISTLTVGLGAGSVASNTALGYEALKANTTGKQNVSVGYRTLLVNTFGDDNVALGYTALDANTTGVSNIAIGTNALGANVLGSENIAIGYEALAANTTASDNVAVGHIALQANTIGTNNIGIGASALYKNTEGGGNIGIGRAALDANTTGQYNVAIGLDALGGNITGSNNIAIGYSAGFYRTTDSNKLFIHALDTGSAAKDLTDSLIVGTFNATPANQTLQINGAISTPYVFTSTLGSGAPLVIASTTVVTNLNADLLDGNHSSAFAPNNYTGAGIDTTAIHDNVASEISAITAKGSPIGADYMLIEDSADTNNKKSITISTLPFAPSNYTGAGIDTTAIHDNVASEISAITAKTEPIDADYLIIEDSADTNNKKSVTRGALFHNSIISYHDATISTLTVGLGAGSIATNTALGYEALKANTTGKQNVSIGYRTLLVNTFGDDNVAVGHEALKANTTGVKNTAIGKGSLVANTFGNQNTAVGYYSSWKNTEGVNNTSLGYQALYSNETGQGNIAIGIQALYSSTVDYNIAIGYTALYANTTGVGNTALGVEVLKNNTIGISNVGIGYQTLNTNVTGNYNVGIGYTALNKSIVSNLTAVGYKALYANTTGITNTAVGYQTLMANTIGTQNTAVGYNALLANITASGNTAIGYNALTDNTTGESNIALGTALAKNTYGNYNIGIGTSALSANETGIHNIAIGKGSLWKNLSDYNIAIGSDAMSTNTIGTNNIAIGYTALYGNTTGVDNIAIGTASLNKNTIGIYNTAIGSGALDTNTTGNYNVAIGAGALSDNIIGNNNIAIGHESLKTNTTDNNVAIGYQAAYHNTIGEHLVALGYNALHANTTGVNNVAIGHAALDANDIGIDNIAIGTSALGANTEGNYNIAIGYNPLLVNTTGVGNVAIGYGALDANTIGVENIAIGYNALTANITGDNNIAIGRGALATATAVSANTAVGYQALNAATGGDNTALGMTAGNGISTGTNNTCLGHDSDTDAATTSNQVSIGDANITTAYMASAIVPEFIRGLTMTRSATYITFTAGACTSSDGKYILKIGAFDKALEDNTAYQQGSSTTNNGLLTAGRTAIAWYYVYVILLSDGTIDIGYDTASTPTNPSGLTILAYRRIGYIWNTTTEAAANIRAFKQYGDYFWWVAPEASDCSLTGSTTAAAGTVFCPPSTEGMFSVTLDSPSNQADVYGVIYSTDQSAVTPGITIATVTTYAAGVIPATDGSHAVIHVSSTSTIMMDISDVNITLYVRTLGWIDQRTI